MEAAIPKEISGYFNSESFRDYPFVTIPQRFSDSRGEIINIADGTLGDVALITSQKGAVRANHIHLNDWHLCFLIEGKMDYHWQEKGSLDFQLAQVNPGQLIFTPSETAHKIVFNSDSIFLSISKLSRTTSNYEADTRRLDDSYFH